MKKNIKIVSFILILILFGTVVYYFSDKQESSIHYHIPEMVNCKNEAPYGWPYLIKYNSKYICRSGYGTLYDNKSKIPVWVTYTLTPTEAVGCIPRTNSFMGDPDLQPNTRSEVSDYLRSGYDMGHLAPSADMSWSDSAEKESFYLSNIAPQLPKFNRGIWKELESDIRNLSYNENVNITVYTGPIYSKSDKFIGKNKVTVPTGYYKILIDNANKKSYAFLFPHAAISNIDYSRYQTTVFKIENETGINFPVLDNKRTMNGLWKNGKSIVSIKKTQCKI